MATSMWSIAWGIVLGFIILAIIGWLVAMLVYWIWQPQMPQAVTAFVSPVQNPVAAATGAFRY